jgi:hypothetical protein
MAIFTYTVRADFSAPGYFFVAGPSSVFQMTSTLLQLKTPDGHYQEYYGSFSYTYSGGYKYLSWPGSQVTGLKSYSSNWILEGSVSGLNVPGSTLKSYADNNDFAGLKTYIMKDSDVHSPHLSAGPGYFFYLRKEYVHVN